MSPRPRDDRRQVDFGGFTELLDHRGGSGGGGPWIPIGIVVGIVVGLVIWWAASGPVTPEPPLLAPTATPTAAPVVVPPTRTARPTPPPEREPTRMPTPRPTATPTPAPSSTPTPVPTRAPTSTPTPGPSEIDVITTPSGAEVVVDGLFRGRSPVRLRDVDPGRHVILLRKDGYNDYTREVVVQPANRYELEVRLGRVGPNP